MKTFEDFIFYNIKWLKNEINYHPQWKSFNENINVDPETLEIMDHLLYLNNHGFYTVSSQPFVMNKQVPFVNGYITKDKLNEIMKKNNQYICLSWDKKCKHNPLKYMDYAVCFPHAPELKVGT